MESASLYSDFFYFENANVHADAVSSPKQTILHTYRNEINTVSQLQLNYSTNIHLLIPWFMKSTVYITRFFPVDPDDRVIMELQCTRMAKM